MAKKNGTVSATQIDKYLKTLSEIETVDIQYGDEKLEFTVKRFVDTAAFADMVRRAADNVFIQDDDGDELYVPAFEPVARASAVLSCVANFGDELTTARAAKLMYSDVMKKIMEIWDERQQYEFSMAVDEAISYRNKLRLSMERYRLNMISDQLDRAMTAMQSSVAMLDGVDPNDFSKMVKNLGAVDEADMIKAVVAAAKDAK